MLERSGRPLELPDQDVCQVLGSACPSVDGSAVAEGAASTEEGQQGDGKAVDEMPEVVLEACVWGSEEVDVLVC